MRVKDAIPILFSPYLYYHIHNNVTNILSCLICDELKCHLFLDFISNFLSSLLNTSASVMWSVDLIFDSLQALSVKRNQLFSLYLTNTPYQICCTRHSKHIILWWCFDDVFMILIIVFIMVGSKACDRFISWVTAMTHPIWNYLKIINNFL